MANRRKFITNSSLAIGSLFVPVNRLFSTETRLKQPAEPKTPATPLKTRKSINTISDTDPILISYRKAVQVMKSRPDSDPRSWNAQAKIHLNFCPHGNWFFLPWHRAYLYYFEEICREASGDPNFILPYWDWTEYPQVPSSFWGQNNPLYDQSRRVTQSDVINSEFVGKEVIQSIMDLPSFEDFASSKSTMPRGGTGGATGELEGTPHNNVHGFIRGNMATYMSPLDPIFWLHHANVDRIWAMWNDSGKKNPNDRSYVDFVLNNNFCNGAGAAIDVKVGDVFDCRKMGYIYDSQKPLLQPEVVFTSAAFTFVEQPIVATNALQLKKFVPLSVPVEITSNFREEVMSISKSSSDDRIIRLVLRDITPPEKENLFIRVFINCDYLSASTPINDPHYVRSFAFFASNHAHDGMSMDGHNMNHGTSFAFDITKTVKKIINTSDVKDIGSKLNVQLLSMPANSDDKSIPKITTPKFEIVVGERRNE